MLVTTHRMRSLTWPGALGRLIVADTEDSAYAIVRQLTAPDRWEVKYAGTTEELMRALHAGPTRLALVNMALVDEQMLRELTERSRRGLSVVITADEHSEWTERRARLMGPVFYAPKPLHIVVLRQVLEGVLWVAV